MWSLYNTLEGGIPEKQEVYLFDEILKIIQNISTYNFKQALRIMYGEDFPKDKNPIEFATLFAQGIKKTDFIVFVGIIKELRGD